MDRLNFSLPIKLIQIRVIDGKGVFVAVHNGKGVGVRSEVTCAVQDNLKNNCVCVCAWDVYSLFSYKDRDRSTSELL